ncbi:MAG: histidine-type phosphatase [Bacteroidales bacterium]|nr:histidine-type phosphatase [Bacteroidales bacterium]
MKNTSRTLAALAALLLCIPLSAQSGFEEFIREDPDRAAGVHHSYEYIPGTETPAPRGYKPFYVSHYGRHGSRRAIGSSAERAFEMMTAAREAGILTAEGEALYQAVNAIHEDHIGMAGELTARGGREHRAIAQRLYNRFPRVFKDRARTQVHVQSSNIPRCLISMANFTSSLDDNAPQLRFDFVTGEKYINLLAHDYYEKSAISAASSALLDSMGRVHIDPSRFMKAVCIDDPARVRAVIPDAHTFMFQVWLFAGMQQDTETPVDHIFTRFFTIDELIGWYRCYNSRIYNSMANSAEFGDHVIWAARGLVQDVIDRADAALAAGSDTAADLRFGHDTGILPLAGLMDLIGPGDRVHNADASDSWQSFRRVPMGSNLQMVFFRKNGADPIVKIYYNEQETLVRGLEPLQGPYYRWADLKAHLEKRIAQFTF